MKTVTTNLKMKVPQHHHRRKTKRNLRTRSVQIRKEIQAEVVQVDVHEAEEDPGQGLEVDQEVLGDPREDEVDLGVKRQAVLGIGADQGDRLPGEEVDHVIDLEDVVERPADHVVDRQVVVETERLIDHAAGPGEEAEPLGGLRHAEDHEIEAEHLNDLGHVEEAELPNGLGHVEEAGHQNGLVIEAGHQVQKGVNREKEASHQNVLKADADLHQNRRSARRRQKRKRKKKKKKNLLLRKKRKKTSQRKRRKRRKKRLRRRRNKTRKTRKTLGRPMNMMRKKKKKGKRKRSKECQLSQNRIRRIVLSSGKSRERLETSHTMRSKMCFYRSVVVLKVCCCDYNSNRKIFIANEILTISTLSLQNVSEISFKYYNILKQYIIRVIFLNREL